MNKRYLICPKCNIEMTVNKPKTGSKAKKHGQSFEYTVAKKMSSLTGFRWKKTPRSGGAHIAGDVFCLDFKFPYPIECKNLESLNLLKVYKNPAILARINWKDPLKDILIFNDTGTPVVIIHHDNTMYQDAETWGQFETGDGWFYILKFEVFCDTLKSRRDEYEG